MRNSTANLNNAASTKRPTPHGAPRLSNLEMCCGFDRVTVWLDTPEPPVNLEKALSCRCDLLLRSMEFNPLWKFKVELHQPSLADLTVLAELEKLCGVHLAYVEVTIDIAPSQRGAPEELAALILGSTFPAGARAMMQDSHGTYYSNRRAGDRVLAIYLDKPSKLADSSTSLKADRCFHMELRLSGKEALQQVHLVCPSDLINFDHYAFWIEELCIYHLNDSIVGNLIVETTKTGPATPSYVAKRWKDRFLVNGQFCLQNAYVEPAGKKMLAGADQIDLWTLLNKYNLRIGRSAPDRNGAADWYR